MNKKIFTPSIKKKLHDSGFNNLYDIITYLPFRLQQIQPLDRSYNHSSEIQYLYMGKLINISHRKGVRAFMVLDFSGEINLSGYLFSVSKFTMATLKTDNYYQLLLTKKDNLWSIKRYAPYNPDKIDTKNFVLGKAKSKNHLLPVYKKINHLKNTDFQKIHRKLQSGHYNLNLEGLIPKNNILDQSINLAAIHKPTDQNQFTNTLKQWIALKNYLKISIIKYKDLQNQKKTAKITEYNKDYLNSITLSLNYKLSKTQIQTISDLVNEITY